MKIIFTKDFWIELKDEIKYLYSCFSDEQKFYSLLLVLGFIVPSILAFWFI